jgi:hypothetical protein
LEFTLAAEEPHGLAGTCISGSHSPVVFSHHFHVYELGLSSLSLFDKC